MQVHLCTLDKKIAIQNHWISKLNIVIILTQLKVGLAAIPNR